MKLINEMFPNANATKTHKGAMARITRYFEAAGGENNTDLSSVKFSVVQRPDGLFLAVAIVKDNSAWLMHGMMDHHICVTN